MTTPPRGIRRRVGLVLLASLATVGLGAAASAPAAAVAPSASSQTSWLRAAHLIPEVGAMTIRLIPFSGSASKITASGSVPEAMAEGTTRILEPAVGYGTVGDYRQIPAGLYAVTIRPVGSATTGTPLLAGTVEAKPDQALTLAAIGTKAAPRIQSFTDDLSRPAAGSANVRLLPAVPGASAVTVTARNGPVLAENAPFGKPTDYATVPAGRWTLDLTTTGTSTDATPVTASVTVAGGGVYTVFVLGSGGMLTLKPVVDAQGVGAAPMAGVQTGSGGMAVRPVDGRLVGGLALAAGGLLGLLGLVARPGRRRERPVAAGVR